MSRRSGVIDRKVGDFLQKKETEERWSELVARPELGDINRDEDYRRFDVSGQVGSGVSSYTLEDPASSAILGRYDYFFSIFECVS